MKTKKEFLEENRNDVISYYNENVKGYYNVSLCYFMTDLINNFRKITNGDDFKKFDLFGNLAEAKSRLGLFTHKTEADDKKTEALRKKYWGTAAMALV
jgi:hypothetical protein